MGKGNDPNTACAQPVSDLLEDPRGRPAVPSGAAPRQIDDFSRGFCHVLAACLHDDHGLQLHALGTAADAWSTRTWKGIGGLPRHIYCTDRHGRPVDINGAFADHAAICRFYADQHNPDEQLISIPVTRHEIDELPGLGYSHWGKQERKITRKVLRRLNLHDLPA